MRTGCREEAFGGLVELPDALLKAALNEAASALIQHIGDAEQ